MKEVEADTCWGILMIPAQKIKVISFQSILDLEFSWTISLVISLPPPLSLADISLGGYCLLCHRVWQQQTNRIKSPAGTVSLPFTALTHANAPIDESPSSLNKCGCVSKCVSFNVPPCVCAGVCVCILKVLCKHWNYVSQLARWLAPVSSWNSVCLCGSTTPPHLHEKRLSD